MKILKNVTLVITSILFLFCIARFDLISYGYAQLKGQLKLILNTRETSSLLEDPETPELWKAKIKLIGEVKKFAFDSLGLKPTTNYTTLYNQQNKPVLWVLTGCKPYSFEAKTWWFPFLGVVSYKGFFEKEKGEKAKEELIKQGYDSDLSPTGGWSTLGWFNDPILSNMLKKSDGTLAELIIHELTHGTIFLKDQVDFNENFATFIGEQGAKQFLINKGYESKSELSKYLLNLEDENSYGSFLTMAQKNLDSLYLTFKADKQMSNQKKSKEKIKFISQLMQQLNTLTFYNKTRYTFDWENDSLPNNTYFMSNYRYRKDQKKMESILNFSFDNNLKKFITWVKESNSDLVMKRLSE